MVSTVPHANCPAERVFPCPLSARKAGYRSRTDWAGLGRAVPDDVSPSGVVVRRTERHRGATVFPVVDDLGGGVFLVAVDYYRVYSLEQTAPSRPAIQHRRQPVREKTVRTDTNRKTVNRETIKSTSSPPSSVALAERGRNRCKASVPQSLAATSLHETGPDPLAPVGDRWVMVPEALSDADRADLGPDLEAAMLVMHMVYQFRFSWETKKPADAWIDLHYLHCFRVFDGRDTSGKRWYAVRNKMLSLDLLEMTDIDRREDEYGLGIVIDTDRGLKGQKAFGYRLRADLRRSTHRRVAVTDPEVRRAVERRRGDLRPVHRWLARNLPRITVADVPDDVMAALAADAHGAAAKGKLAAHRQMIEDIRAGHCDYVVDDFSGRFHTPLTRLPRGLRPYLRVDGLPLCQIDIPCSQPLWVGVKAKQAGYDAADYLHACQTDLYSLLARDLGVARDEVKRQLAQGALFASNRSHKQRCPAKRLFDRKFPGAAEYIYDQKARAKAPGEDKPHNRLAILAQVAERRFIIDSVCARIRRERPDEFVATIHDSVVMLRRSADYVMMVMRDEFEKLNLYPKLKVEAYAPEDR